MLDEKNKYFFKMKFIMWSILCVLFSFDAYCVEKIKIGAYINDIQNLDLKSHSYSMDFYVWFKWKNPNIDPSKTIEFMNPSELWGHTITKNYEIPKTLESGELYQVMRVQGRFSYKFNLRDYPFDKQKLVVTFEDNEMESRDAVYEIDSHSPISLNPDLVFPGFQLKKPIIFIKKIQHPTTFGYTASSQNSAYDRVIIEIPIHRPILAYSVKLLLPILCVVFVAALMLLFSPSYIESRVSIGITAILTVVALQITLGGDLPEIDYLVLIDKIYLLTYMFIVAGLFIVLKGSWDIEKEQKTIKEISRLDLKSLTILTGTYIALCSLIIFTSLISS